MSDGTIRQTNVLVHLLALAALGHYRGQADALRRGLATLATVQCPDGGFTLTPDMSTTITGMGAASLAAAGMEQERLTDRLAGLQRPSGAWTFSPGATQTDVETTFFVLEALVLTEHRKYAEALEQGCDYLCTMQQPDGGLNNYARGAPSEPSHTCQAISIWAAHDPERYAPELNAAVQFVLSRQHADGGYSRNWSASDANVVMRAVDALHAALLAECLAPGLRLAARRSLAASTEYLLRRQNHDGGWGQTPARPSDSTSTAYALTALATVGADPTATARAAAYLCRTQRRDGGFHAPPDTYAPRPLLIEIKALCDIYALRALAVYRAGLAATDGAGRIAQARRMCG